MVVESEPEDQCAVRSRRDPGQGSDVSVPTPARQGQSQRLGGVRAVFQSFGAKLLVVGLNAGTGMFTARLLHPAGRGELAALLLWPQILSGMATLGLPSALTYFLRLKPQLAARYVRAGILMAGALALLVSAAGIAAAPYLLRQYSPDVIFAARFLMPNTAVGILLLLGRGALEARGDFGRSNLALLCPPLLTLIGLVCVRQANVLTPITAALVYIVAGFPALAMAIYGLPLRYTKSIHPIQGLRRAASELLSYGVRSFGNDLCGTLAFYVDQALVVTLLSPAFMGYYVVALSLSRVLGVAHQAIAVVLFPRLVGLPRHEAIGLTGRALRMSTAISVLPAVALAFAGPWALTLFYGPSYSRLNGVLQVLVAEAMLSGCIMICTQLFMASNRPGMVTLQQLTGLAATVPLLVLLIPRYGVMGAAVAVLSSTVLRFAFMAASFPLVFHERVPSLIPGRDDANWLRVRLNRLRRSGSLAVAVPE
jgi:O-antigen/teichoic acid export membrane protein